MGKKTARELYEEDARTPRLERYVEQKEVMAFLGIKSKTTLTKLIKKYRIKVHKFSHKFVRYKLSDFERAAEDARVS